MTTLKPEIIISKLVIMTQTQTHNNDLKNSYLQTRNYDFQIHNRDFNVDASHLQEKKTNQYNPNLMWGGG